MFDVATDSLAWLGTYAVPIGWLTLTVFLLGSVTELFDRRVARPVVVAAWLLFGLFWLSVVNHYLIEQKSIIEGVGAIVAVPLSVWIGYLLARGRDSLFVLSRAIAAMGVIYVPFVTIEALRRPLVEIVTDQTQFVINLLGFDPAVVSGMELANGEPIAAKTRPYESTFVFYKDNAGPITLNIQIACTGIGSIALMSGLVSAVDAPLGRKVAALAIVVPVIWVLNIVRNVFIAIAFGEQLLHVFPGFVSWLFAISSPRMVSYYVSDRIISQSLSVVVLLALTWVVVRKVPEVVTVLEDLLYVLTRREYDLQSAIGVDSGRAEEAAD